MIKAISHVSFLVKDMKESISFYSDVLGFKYEFSINDDSGSPWLVYLSIKPGQFIELFYGGKEIDEATKRVRNIENNFSQRKSSFQSKDSEYLGSGYLHLCFEVDDINVFVEHIKNKNLELDTQPIMGKDGNVQCWISDPDGNRIEIMQISSSSPQAKSY